MRHRRRTQRRGLTFPSPIHLSPTVSLFFTPLPRAVPESDSKLTRSDLFLSCSTTNEKVPGDTIPTHRCSSRERRLPLVEAVGDGDLPRARALVEGGVDVGAANNCGGRLPIPTAVTWISLGSWWSGGRQQTSVPRTTKYNRTPLLARSPGHGPLSRGRGRRNIIPWPDAAARRRIGRPPSGIAPSARRWRQAGRGGLQGRDADRRCGES